VKILPIDKNRIIIKQANASKITGKWKDAVDLIVERYKTIFGSKLVSVYINGSVATGDAIEGTLDIDTNAIVDMTDEEITELDRTILPNQIKFYRLPMSMI
jgi:predicted nucleotidyltransferase